MDDRLPRISAEAERVISLLLIHTGHQQILKRCELAYAGEDIPRVSLLIRGLVDDPWPLSLKPIRNGQFFGENFEGPPILITGPLSAARSPVHSNIQLLVNGARTWEQPVTILPAYSIPRDPKQFVAMTALIRPNDATVARYVDQIRNSFSSLHPKLGFPGLGSIGTADALYAGVLQIASLSYGLEPAPHQLPLQLVRSPAEILHRGEANCIDLALFLAASFERSYLRPLIILLRHTDDLWHAIPGVRNTYSGHAMPICFDMEDIKAQCASPLVRLFDPDAISYSASANQADTLARDRLTTAREAIMIDTAAARAAGIWPLAFVEDTIVPVSEFVHAENPNRVFLPQRNGAEYSDAWIRSLSDDTVLIIGDSLNEALAPGRNELAQALLDHLPNYVGVDDLLAIGTELERSLGREKLVSVTLSALTKSPFSRQNSPYNKLSKLPFKTIVSFFPDAVLERTVRMGRRSFRVIIDDDDLTQMPADGSERELYLLGGSAISGKGLVLTVADHQRLHRRIRYIARGLRDRLAQGTHILIQCDLSDPNLSELYFEATTGTYSATRNVVLCGVQNQEAWLDETMHQVKIPPSELLIRLEQTAFSITRQNDYLPLQPELVRPSRQPFKYLDPFDTEDADLFFGRASDIEVFSREIRSSRTRTAVLYGRSGVGKTSLAKAGLIPFLKGHLDVRAVYTRGTNEPLKAVISALLAGNYTNSNPCVLANPTLEQVLISLQSNGSPEQILFFDQTEELFFRLGLPAITAFLNEILECTNKAAARLRVVFIIREDYLAQLLSMGSGQFSTMHRLLELEREAARDAIMKPALACGIVITEDAIEAILDDLSPDRILPAHLQIVCDRLFRESIANSKVDLSLYERVGRAEAILRTYLSNALAHMAPDAAKIALNILQTLVTSEGTRGVLHLAEIANRSALTLEQVQRSLHPLIYSERLVRENVEWPDTYELAHDLLAAKLAELRDDEGERRQEIQELLSQELANSKIQNNYRFPLDKAKLVDNERERLDITDEAVVYLYQSLSVARDIDAFWQRKVSDLPIFFRVRAIFGCDLIEYDEKTDRILFDAPAWILAILPPMPFSSQLANSLAISFFSEPLSCDGWLGFMLALDSSSTLIKKLVQIGGARANEERLRDELLSELVEISIINIQDAEIRTDLFRLVTRFMGIPKHWQTLFDSLSIVDQYYVSVGLRVHTLTEQDLQVILEEPLERFALLPEAPLSSLVASAVVEHIIHAPPPVAQKCWRLLVKDNSGATLLGVAQYLHRASDTRVLDLVNWFSFFLEDSIVPSVELAYFAWQLSKRSYLPAQLYARMSLLSPAARLEVTMKITENFDSIHKLDPTDISFLCRFRSAFVDEFSTTAFTRAVYRSGPVVIGYLGQLAASGRSRGLLQQIISSSSCLPIEHKCEFLVSWLTVDPSSFRYVARLINQSKDSLVGILSFLVQIVLPNTWPILIALSGRTENDSLEREISRNIAQIVDREGASPEAWSQLLYDLPRLHAINYRYVDSISRTFGSSEVAVVSDSRALTAFQHPIVLEWWYERYESTDKQIVYKDQVSAL